MHAYEPVLCKEFPLHHVFIYLCAEKVETVIKVIIEKSRDFHGTGIEIWAGFGLIGSTEKRVCADY